VEFVGGPLCGWVDRVEPGDLTPYANCIVGGREYCYQFKFVHGKGSGSGIKVKRRWVFRGHAVKPSKDE